MLVPALVAAAVLGYAGAAKVLDPTMTAGALRAMGLPGHPTLVRAGSIAELALAVLAVAVGGAALWLMVGASYVLFGLFVVAALASGRPIASCGCFGRADVPPSWRHVGLNVVLAAAALAWGLAELS